MLAPVVFLILGIRPSTNGFALSAKHVVAAPDEGIEQILANAATAYSQKEYAQSVRLYRAAIDLGENRGSIYYSAACSAALGGDAETAFDLLDKAIAHGFTNPDGIAADADLTSLRNDPRWNPELGKAREKLHSMLPPGIDLEWKARTARKEKRYADAGSLYAQASLKGGLYPWDDWFAAVNYLAAGDKDKVFASLDRMVLTYPYIYHFDQIKDFLPLHSDPRWAPAMDRLNKARERDLSPDQKIYGLSQFWQEARNNFAYFDKVPGLDWDKTYREYIPKVLATRSRYEYVLVLQRFCALLKDGHTNVFMPGDIAFASLPLQFTAVGSKMFVTNATEDVVKEIPLGSEVVEVNGTPAARYASDVLLPTVSSSTDYVLWDNAAFALQQGLEDHSLSLRLRRPDGSEMARSFKYVANQAKPFVVQQKQRPLLEYKDLGDGLAYVALNSFDDAKIKEQFEQLLPQLAGCKGLIIDIRRNGGGSGSNGYAIAAHLTDKPLLTSTWRTRQSRSANRAWGFYAMQGNGGTDNMPYYTGDSWYQGVGDLIQPSSGPRLLMPTAILTDHPTASAAEDFLIVMDKAPQATRIGRRSYGSSGQPLLMYLPGNITARVCTKRDTYPDGRDFVGVGVIPTVEVEPTIDDIVSGRDVILNRAIEVLKSKIGSK